MFDDFHPAPLPPRDAIPPAAALRALPLQSPPRSAWPALAAALASGKQRPPRYWPWALAASLALAVGSAGTLRTAPEAMMAPTASAVAPMRELLLESAQLEALIARSSDVSTSAPLMALSTDLEDQLALIDAQLGDPALNANSRLPLWQQRVRLLRELAGLQATQQWLATRGEQSAADALVYTW